MSTTSRGLRVPGDTDDVAGTTRAHATQPRDSVFHRLIATDNRVAGAVARLTLGLIMFPHAAQKVFGWFGGYGFEGTMGYFTGQLGLPGMLGGLVIIVELLASLLLIIGAFTRVAALGIVAIMVGAIVTVHASNGFFMNWYGKQPGEGFEYHLLAIGLALVIAMLGGGSVSVDRALSLRRGMEGGGVGDPVTRD